MYYLQLDPNGLMFNSVRYNSNSKGIHLSRASLGNWVWALNSIDF